MGDHNHLVVGKVAAEHTGYPIGQLIHRFPRALIALGPAAPAGQKFLVQLLHFLPGVGGAAAVGHQLMQIRLHGQRQTGCPHDLRGGLQCAGVRGGEHQLRPGQRRVGGHLAGLLQALFTEGHQTKPLPVDAAPHAGGIIRVAVPNQDKFHGCPPLCGGAGAAGQPAPLSVNGAEGGCPQPRSSSVFILHTSAVVYLVLV